MRYPPLFPLARTALVCLATLTLAAGAQAAGDKSAYESAKASAKSTYETASKQCDAMNGNAKDVCVAEANYKVAKERCDARTGNDKDVCIKVAKAELTRAEADAKATRKTADARNDAAKDKREAEYNVAAQKCDAMNGDAKSACVKDAKAKYGM